MLEKVQEFAFWGKTLSTGLVTFVWGIPVTEDYRDLVHPSKTLNKYENRDIKFGADRTRKTANAEEIEYVANSI